MPHNPTTTTSNFRTPKCPYACTTCGLCFSAVESLIHHQKEHAKGLQLACPDCGARFGRHDGYKIHHKRLHASGVDGATQSPNRIKLEDDDSQSISSIIDDSPEPERVNGICNGPGEVPQQSSQVKAHPSSFQSPADLAESQQLEWIGRARGERPPRQKRHLPPFGPENSLLETTKARVQRGGRGRPSLKDRRWTDDEILEHRRRRNRSKDRRRREKQKRRVEASQEQNQDWELKNEELWQRHGDPKGRNESLEDMPVEVRRETDACGAFLSSIEEYRQTNEDG